MATGGLWGSFPLIPGTQNLPATAAQNANPLPVSAWASPSLTYNNLQPNFADVPDALTKGVNVSGSFAGVSVPYLQPVVALPASPPSALLPIVTQAATGTEYYQQ